MQVVASTDTSKAFAGALSSTDVAALMRSKDEQIALLSEQVAALKHQLEWFRRQIFGQKSERFSGTADPMQMYLGEIAGTAPPAEDQHRPIAAHTRRIHTKDAADTGEELKFFDESRVPVRTMILAHADVQGLSPEQYEIIGEKRTYRLAQRPGAYEVICYRRPVIKLKDSGQQQAKILCLAAPEAILQSSSRADVSFVAGVLVDKFAWHLPLYRQHQRLEAAGINVSRPWLTQISQGAISLLMPIYEAQFASIRHSRVKAMDETPIKAGRSGHGKMNTGYFWPVYGERDEVCFPFHASRAAVHVRTTLGLTAAPGAVLLTDGYAAYQQYAQKTGLTHAQCWAHARRTIFEAQAADPDATAQALAQIAALYAVEDEIRERNLAGEAKQRHRQTHSKPKVERFFDWLDRQYEKQGLTPSNPFVKALNYVRERRTGLEVFIADPDVPMDTNHLERALRAIPMGRKSWLFCWTELGAKHVGVIQSLIVTCRLHGIDPYTYLVDVLQRISDLPDSRVAELTPRRWKELYSADPMRSDIHAFRD